MIGMAKKNRKDDRHSPDSERLTLRLRRDLNAGLAKLVEYTGTDNSTELRIALRERLEKFGLWPPSKDTTDL